MYSNMQKNQWVRYFHHMEGTESSIQLRNKWMPERHDYRFGKFVIGETDGINYKIHLAIPIPFLDHDFGFFKVKGKWWFQW